MLLVTLGRVAKPLVNPLTPIPQTKAEREREREFKPQKINYKTQ